MKVALSFLACLLVANAAVLPQKGLGVTKDEIDSLVKDAMLVYRDMAKVMEPIKAGSVDIPVQIEGLKVKAADAKLWIGETSKYSESSSLTDEELDLSVDIVQKDIRVEGLLQITGTSLGKKYDQEGQIKISISTVGKKTILSAQLTPKSVTLVNLDAVSEIGDISVQVTGIEINGISKSTLESEIAKSIKELFVKSEESARKLLPEAIEQFNKLIGKHNLQEVYDWLRKHVPSS